MRGPIIALAVMLVIAGLLAVLFQHRIADALAGPGVLNLVYLLMAGVLVGSGVFARGEGSVGQTLKNAALWLGIAVGFVGLYAYRGEISGVWGRISGELRPAMAVAVDEPPFDAASGVVARPLGGAAALRKADDGHFWAEATVNGSAVRFMVDTGASTVALTALDARRAGIPEGSLTFNIPVNTANGQTFAAGVRLDAVSIGNVRLENVDAVVLREGLSTSLLGMSFLGRLSKVEATPETLILRP